MLDRLLDFVLQFLQIFQFWVVITEYERGVVLHFGRFCGRVLEPGIHWRWPFHIDGVQFDNVVTRTHMLPPQALTTKDNKTVSVTAVVTSNIRDIKKALLEVEGVAHALQDSCSAAVGEHVGNLSWEELRGAPAAAELLKVCRKQAFKYGIEIERVQLSDLALCKVIRLHTAQNGENLPVTY
jgi:regulator of protease activity HflC (stomatin/prohibitin superfamily)